jgi:hypothetical protein
MKLPFVQPDTSTITATTIVATSISPDITASVIVLGPTNRGSPCTLSYGSASSPFRDCSINPILSQEAFKGAFRYLKTWCAKLFARLDMFHLTRMGMAVIPTRS